MLFPPPQRSSPLARVVITGAGVVTPLGLDWQSNSEGFRTGRTAFKKVTLFDVSRQRVKSAAEVSLPTRIPTYRLSRRHGQKQDRAAKLLLLAAADAWNQARFEPGPIPIVLGTTSGGMSLGQEYYRHATQQPCTQRRQPSRLFHYLAQRQGMDISDAFGASGPVTIIANACASGANAIGHAWDLVRRGYSNQALAGGYDALSQLVFSGFDSLQALSPTRCRPFDTHRDGLALGEGAAVLALETLDSARRRNVSPLAEIVGYGSAIDLHHLTQPHPDGSAAVRAMTAACQEAGLQPSQISYVNAHGTGTPLNDSSEAAAIQSWAGSHTPHLAVSSTKASIGHLLGAAGAVEALVCVMALRGQWLPPSATVDNPEPNLQFQLIRSPTPAPFEFALSNSFGFGGANASLIFKRCHD